MPRASQHKPVVGELYHRTLVRHGVPTNDVLTPMFDLICDAVVEVAIVAGGSAGGSVQVSVETSGRYVAKGTSLPIPEHLFNSAYFTLV